MCTIKAPKAPEIVKAEPPAPPPQSVASAVSAASVRAPEAPVLNEASVKGNGRAYSTKRGRTSMVIPLSRSSSASVGGASTATGVNVPT